MPFDSLPPPIVREQPAAEAGCYVFRDECVLGTRMLLAFVAESFQIAREAALVVRAEIDRLRQVLNERDSNSELSQLNRSRLHAASAELFAVIARAEAWRLRTQGAFSPRLGRVLAPWREATTAPLPPQVLDLAQAAHRADVILIAATRTIVRPEPVVFALEGFAKGWIVDRAFEAACRVPGVAGALVDIGGDIRCGGCSPQAHGWQVGIPDPALPFDNAPLVAMTRLHDEGIATSGRGPRDRIADGHLRSTTLSPFTGWPVHAGQSATVIAANAADADALATATLVLDEREAMDLAARNAAALRKTRADGTVSTGHGERFPLVAAAPSPPTGEWAQGWQALATFTAPRRQLIRDPSFRSPYLAMWITDTDNRPVRTLILVGKRPDWQRDNYIWWSMNRSTTDRLMTTRSMSTSGSGVYNVFWDGVDDVGRRVSLGTYVLHVETSRERGKHTYRSLTLDLTSARRFVEELPPTEEGGGLRVSFDRY